MISRLFRADFSNEKLSVVILLEIRFVQRSRPVPVFGVASTDTPSADQWYIVVHAPQMTEFFLNLYIAAICSSRRTSLCFCHTPLKRAERTPKTHFFILVA